MSNQNQPGNNRFKIAVVMGSQSDWPIMKHAVEQLEAFGVEYEAKVVSAHRTPELLFEFAGSARENGFAVIIAGAGGAAHLPGVMAALTPIPVIGVPINASISIDGWDSILSILQMPPGIPVATVGINGAQNAGILAAQILAAGDPEIFRKTVDFKEALKQKIEKANEELRAVKYDYKVE